MEIILEVIVSLFPFVYVIIFFGSMLVWLRFEWGSEGKDERGREILNKSYSIVFPFVPFGWFILEMINDYIYTLSYAQYKYLIWYLLSGLMIVHAVNITILKRKY